MSTDKIEKFRQMLAKNPDNELALYSLGSALLEAGSFAEAEPHFRRALESKPDWVMACILRARCLIRLRRYDEARELLETGRVHSLRQNHASPVEEIDEMLEELP